MPPVDPYAPASSPRHPRNVKAQRENTDTFDEEAQRQERQELQATHLTPGEREAQDSSGVPTLDGLRLRRDALVDYLIRLDDDQDAPAPTIVDTAGVAHHLVIEDDGHAAHWEPVPHTEDRDGDGYDDMKVADLEQLLKDRSLPHTGVKADLIARLRDDDAAKRSQDAAEGVVVAPEGDDLDSALADLDAARGNR